MTVKMTGPVFDGRARKTMGKLVDDATQVVADEGETEIQQRLGVVLRNPTGFYSSQIKSKRLTSERSQVTDSDVVYGPWLEGTSSRNSSTRFKGYATFRKISQKLQRNVVRITRPVVKKRVREMNR